MTSVTVRGVLLLCVVAVPVGAAVGWGLAVVWDRLEDIDWPRRRD